jgi:hypothetical protein
MTVWIDQFREDIKEAEAKAPPAEEGVDNPLSMSINMYIKNYDPTYKGVLTKQDISELETDAQEELGEVPPEMRNSREKLTFSDL